MFEHRAELRLAAWEVRAVDRPSSARGIGMILEWVAPGLEGRTDEAEDQFRASIRFEPNALTYDFLGMLEIRRGAMQEAERDFRAALSLDEFDSNAHFGLGYIYKAAGRRAEALNQYQAGLVKDPTNPPGAGCRRETAAAEPRRRPLSYATSAITAVYALELGFIEDG
jgi:tetratricopeptide (TPR) repeat protein